MGVHDDYDDEELWCIQIFNSRSRAKTFILIGVLYPFFMLWTLVGTIWYAEAGLHPELCFKEERQSQFFMLWLIVFYIWLIAYTTFITASVLVQHRQHSLGEHLLLDDYETLPRGLSPRSINCLDVQINQKDGEWLCSICLEESKVGERMRTLVCGHGFHTACIDNWLWRQSTCPNCKRSQRRRELEVPLLLQY